MIAASLTRRTFLVSSALAAVAAGWARPASSASRDPRLVVVHLSGGLDGLAAVPPIGDPAYEAVARGLRPAAEDALPLDGFFGLHPALRFLHSCYLAGEAVVWHAAATPYRGGSHIEASRVLEAGLARPGPDGWLNRAAVLAVTRGRLPALLAIGTGMPLVIRGAVPATLCSAEALGLASPQQLANALSSPTRGGAPIRVVAAGLASTRPIRPSFRDTMVRLGEVLAEPAGPRMASLALSGWDTHADQPRRLSARLSTLDGGLAGLRDGAGAAWRETAVLAVGEFGRAVGANGSGGTDHGLAAAGFLLGGAVEGGRVLADWPGLAPTHRHEDGSLRPTRDVRDLFAAVLCEHMGLPRDLAARVFPDSPIRPAGPLVRRDLA